MIKEPPVPALVEEPAAVHAPDAAPDGVAGGATPPVVTEENAATPISLRRACLAAFLSAAAAAWMLGGVFDSPLARPLAVLAVVAGVGWAAVTHRSGRPTLVGVLLVPVAFAAASLVSVATDSRVSPLEAVQAAVSGGGLLQPPVAFDAGWRFVLVALCLFVGAATTTLALTTSRPRLALALPLPVVLAGALLQPPNNEVLGAGISLVLAVAALMVMYAAEMAGAGGGQRGFELRRTMRGAGALVLALLVLTVLNRSSFLFPAAVTERAIPPQRPQVEPLSSVKDHVVFTVSGPGDLSGPWRLGDLDVYDGDGNFLLPGYDPQHMRTLSGEQSLQALKGAPVEYTVTVVDPEQRVLPVPAGTTQVTLGSTRAQYDARTETLLLPANPTSAITYTASGEKPPSGQELGAAGQPPASVSSDLAAPPAPAEVRRLLASAPQNPWDRLQFVRQAIYDRAVAKGAGVPGPVPPSRVVEMLAGGQATPYEMAAAQVLLARWAGLPARLGFGYYGGEPAKGGAVEFRPRNGANWAEVYFNGYGWVPVVGIPAHAISPLDANPNNRSPQIHPAQEVSLQLYVPTDASTALLLYEVIRWWLLVISPVAAGAALMVMFFPWPLKMWRRRQRRRTARTQGLGAQIAAEYAELRDVANDLRAGDPYATPLEFLDRLSVDEEHEELAWLVTRALWGDLARDLLPEDAEAAREMASSLSRRLRRGQPWMTRLLALASRASLREPYDRSLPNPWPQPRTRRPAATLGRRYA
ncbi:MAG TPA: transglutaminaseTgpA domain-containing protein [Candidatus Dormibacteraeota bacterium]|nr:transglutaminaseTgpA domain-containing protein [Candidatus Dormibacteraeota bacterium]